MKFVDDRNQYPQKKYSQRKYRREHYNNYDRSYLRRPNLAIRAR